MIALITVAATMSSKTLGLNGEMADEDGFSLNGGNGGGHTRRRANFFTSNTTFLNINVIQSLNKDPDVLGICAIIKQILKEFNFFSALFFYNTIVYF